MISQSLLKERLEFTGILQNVVPEKQENAAECNKTTSCKEVIRKCVQSLQRIIWSVHVFWSQERHLLGAMCVWNNMKHEVIVYMMWCQSSRGMIVKGRMGQLDSSSSAVRKQSGACELPRLCSASPRLLQASCAVFWTCIASLRTFSPRPTRPVRTNNFPCGHDIRERKLSMCVLN